MMCLPTAPSAATAAGAAAAARPAHAGGAARLAGPGLAAARTAAGSAECAPVGGAWGVAYLLVADADLAPVPRFEFMLPALAPPRLPVSRVPALGLLPRLASRVPALGCWRAWFCRAFACRFCMESPRVVPPYLLAVPLSP